MIHRHLHVSPDADAEALPSAAIVDLIERGDLADWRALREAVARDPHGPLAERVLRLVAAYPTYGSSALWRAWIHRLRDRSEGPPATQEIVALSEVRADAGLTQTEVAERLGMSQSDLSKLERRGNPRVSSLQAYARALGGRLRIVLARAGSEREVRPGAWRRKARSAR